MSKIIKCPECGKVVVVSFPVQDCAPKTLKHVFAKEAKHGIEPRWARGRKLRLISYAVWINGNCVVSHATTKAGRSIGDINARFEIERANGNLPII